MKNVGHVSVCGDDGGSSKVIAEDTKCCDCLTMNGIRILNTHGYRITHWMVDSVTVPQPCRGSWVDELVHTLEGVDIWVDLGQL